jgi:hypothetical protein
MGSETGGVAESVSASEGKKGIKLTAVIIVRYLCYQYNIRN